MCKGQKWAKVMKAIEERRQKVTKEEVEFMKKVLSEEEKLKVVKPAKEQGPGTMAASV